MTATAIAGSRVQELTAAAQSGTGTFNLSEAAVSGFLAFADEFSSGDVVEYVIEGETAGEFEVGIGTYTAATPDTLSRTTIIASSNSGSAVNFTSGQHTVYVSPNARTLNRLTLPVIAITDSAVTMTVNRLYQGSTSGLTAERAYTLPDTAAVGDVCAIQITTGHATHDIKVDTAGSGSLINGIDASAGWTEIGQTGASVRYRCVKAGGTGDTDWVEEYDSRMSRGGIEFDAATYMTYDVSNVRDIDIAAGRGVIGGRWREWTAADVIVTAHSYAAVGVHYVYLFDSSGTVSSEVSTTAPVWDTRLGYYIKTSDSTRRYIGWTLVWVGATSNYRQVPFTAVCNNRNITISYTGDSDGTDNLGVGDFQVVVNTAITVSVGDTQFALEGLAGKEWASTEIVPTGVISHWICGAKINNEVGTSDGIIVCVSPNTMTTGAPDNAAFYTVRNEPAKAGTGRTFFGRYDIPWEGNDPYYAGNQISGTCGIEIEAWGGKGVI